MQEGGIGINSIGLEDPGFLLSIGGDNFFPPTPRQNFRKRQGLVLLGRSIASSLTPEGMRKIVAKCHLVAGDLSISDVGIRI